MTPCSPPSRTRCAAARWRAAILDGICARRRGISQVGTKKRRVGRTKKLKGLGGGGGAPRRAAGEDGVGIDQQLSGAGDEGELVGFALGDETAVEGDEPAIPAEGGRQRGGIERAPRSAAAAGDVALALVLSGVVVKRRQSGQGCGV